MNNAAILKVVFQIHHVILTVTFLIRIFYSTRAEQNGQFSVTYLLLKTTVL